MSIEVVSPHTASTCDSPSASNLLIFYDMNQLSSSEPYPQVLLIPSPYHHYYTIIITPLFYHFLPLIVIKMINQLNLPNVLTIFMDYTRPATFDTDFPGCEFLRKPIKESALIRCLREVCAHFDSKQKRASQSLQRVPSNSSYNNNINNNVNTTNNRSQHQVYPLEILVVEGNFLIID